MGGAGGELLITVRKGSGELLPNRVTIDNVLCISESHKKEL
jgi:hypothetical protein